MHSVCGKSAQFALVVSLGALNASAQAVDQKTIHSDPVAAFVSEFATATGIKLVQIHAGTFTMGSVEGEANRGADEGPVMQVTLTEDFYLGATDVTQGQYESVTGTNPSDFKNVGTNAPVEQVTFAEAMAFCEKLTERESATGRLPDGYAFTLPTEAQWEYACRAGTTGPYAGDIPAMSWFDSNSGGTTHPVGLEKPNAWGLYDMSGNVYQWCLDWYAKRYPGGSAIDPTGPATGTVHVLRGGGWYYDKTYCRSAYRDFDPGFRANFIGFRVAISPVQK
jgi:formylglycine-generating enzyme required for sulfatase activity